MIEPGFEFRSVTKAPASNPCTSFPNNLRGNTVFTCTFYLSNNSEHPHPNHNLQTADLFIHIFLCTQVCHQVGTLHCPLCPFVFCVQFNPWMIVSTIYLLRLNIPCPFDLSPSLLMKSLILDNSTNCTFHGCNSPQHMTRHATHIPNTGSQSS